MVKYKELYHYHCICKLIEECDILVVTFLML